MTILILLFLFHYGSIYLFCSLVLSLSLMACLLLSPLRRQSLKIHILHFVSPQNKKTLTHSTRLDSTRLDSAQPRIKKKDLMFPVVVMVYLHRSCGSIVLKRCGAYYFKANLVCLSRVMKSYSYCTAKYSTKFQTHLRA
jgi:hypothetical protein